MAEMTLKDWAGPVVFAALFSLPVALYELDVPSAWLRPVTVFALALPLLFVVRHRLTTADRTAVRNSGRLLMGTGVLLASRSLLAVGLRAFVDLPPNQESGEILVRLLFVFQPDIAIDVTTGLMASVFIFFGYLCFRLLRSVQDMSESSAKSPGGSLFPDLSTSPRVIEHVISRVKGENRKQTERYQDILRSAIYRSPGDPMPSKHSSAEFFRAYGLFAQKFLDVEQTYGHVSKAIQDVKKTLQGKGLLRDG